MGKRLGRVQGLLHSDATFSAQAELPADVKTLAQYAEWMKGMFAPLPNGSYQVKSFSRDDIEMTREVKVAAEALGTGPYMTTW